MENGYMQIKRHIYTCKRKNKVARSYIIEHVYHFIESLVLTQPVYVKVKHRMIERGHILIIGNICITYIVIYNIVTLLSAHPVAEKVNPGRVKTTYISSLVSYGCHWN